MGACNSAPSHTRQPHSPPQPPIVPKENSSAAAPHFSKRESHNSSNMHIVNPDIKIHTVVSSELDYDHEKAMTIPLGEVTDEQLLAEVARRRLDLHDKITDAVVRETYEIGKILGHGASGEVHLAIHRGTGQNFACKVVKKNSSMNDAQSMSTEIEIMKRVRHRNVCSMYELYETPKCLWIILELVDGGDLYHFLGRADQYNEVIAARLMKQILSGVHYLHSLGVVHRDLKLENILLSKTPGSVGDVKIADFGLSALVRIDEDGYDPEESGKRKRYSALTDMWGTKEYFAPELIDQAYGPQADVWALGCVLFEMLTGEQAFPVREHDTESKFYGRIKHGEFNKDLPAWKKVSPEARELVSQMLKVAPTDRWSASECILHPWITGRAHNEKHLQPLVEVQDAIKARIERRRKKAEGK